MEMICLDEDIAVCIKPSGVLSTDEPNGMPGLVRQALGDEKADVRTVHRLDAVVSGLMVLARNKAAASALSEQLRENRFGKEYLAVIHGYPDAAEGTLRDLLLRDKQERKTYVTDRMEKGVQEAILNYRVLNRAGDMSRVQIRLITGRTHQIRAQFSSRGMPLVGDRKYSVLDDGCPIALWSYKLEFCHPTTAEPMTFTCQPPARYPWTEV